MTTSGWTINKLTLKINFSGYPSSIIVGMLVFFVPFFTYLSPDNLRQLSSSGILEIFLSLLILLCVIFISSYCFEILINRLFKKKIILFPLFCFVFYLNFLYAPFTEFFGDLVNLKFSDDRVNETPVFILFEICCILVILFGLKFNRFTIRMILIFSILVLISAFVPLASYLSENLGKKQEIQYDINSDIINQDPVLIKRNVYYIILDAMVGVEISEPFKIASKEEVLDKLSNTQLKYIDKSQSSYSETYFSITSLMLLDYHQKPGSSPYFDYNSFFPGMMYSMQDEVPLLTYLKNADSSFFWSAGKNFLCVPTDLWTCVNSPQDFLPNNLLNFYITTPFPKISKRFFNNIEGQDTIGPFLEYINTNAMPETAFFAYIHHNLPHRPYLVSNECKPADFRNNDFQGYKASYHCVLKTIQMFMEKINTEDPEAIVIFQGDHGLMDDLNLKLTKKEKYLFSGSIFNAVKAPASCFEKYGLPRTNINTIRFALNCAYGFRLPYRENIHYQHTNLGEVTERKLFE